MRGTLIKVHHLKMSKTEGTFYRLEFLMEDGSWAKTDVVPRYRNYSHWKGIIERGKGTTLLGLDYRNFGEVNADSYPVITNQPIPITHKEEPFLQDKLL